MELLNNFKYAEGKGQSLLLQSCARWCYVSSWGVRTVKDDSGCEHNLHDLARKVIGDLSSLKRELTIEEFNACKKISAFYLTTDACIKAKNVFTKFLVWLQDLFSGLTQTEKEFLLVRKEEMKTNINKYSTLFRVVRLVGIVALGVITNVFFILND